MAKKIPALAPPSLQSLQLVLTQARNAPLQNMDHARVVNQALTELEQFFVALLAPQVKPQASASAGGSSSDQSQPGGRPIAPE